MIITNNTLSKAQLARSPLMVTKVYELYKSVHQLYATIPKQYRYSLWDHMNQQTHYIIYHMIKAVQNSKPEIKKRSLEKANDQLAVLKLSVLLGAESKAFSITIYNTINEQMNEVGCMIGGWIRSIRT